MFKKYIAIGLISLSTSMYADNNIGTVGNVGSVGNIGALGTSTTKALNVKYTVYSYQMKPTEFNKFMETKNLSKTAPQNSNTNIISLNTIKKEDLDTLNQKLAKEFSNKFSGNSTCGINSNFCAGGMATSATDIPKTGKPVIENKTSILFKLFSDNKDISAKVISDNNLNNKSDPQNVIFIKSEATLQDIQNKNYVIISQISKQDMLYGQIILTSFGGH